jgi:hypothetical protein
VSRANHQEEFMVTSEMMAELAEGKQPAFIFVCEGLVQHWSQDNHKGIIVATNRQAADVLASKLTQNNGKPVSVSEVGPEQGATLAERISFAVVVGGANGVFVTDDGKTVQWFEAPPAPIG